MHWDGRRGGTYAKILHSANNIPMAALSVMTLPPVKAPITTIKHVFACPTTVLSTAPAIWCFAVSTCSLKSYPDPSPNSCELTGRMVKTVTESNETGMHTSTNDEELRDIDHRSQESREGNHQPDISRGLCQVRESICPGHRVEEENTSKRSLVI